MSANQFDISVVIGAQNARSTIEPCLKALLSQVREQAVEIILVDASTDGTPDIVAKQFPEVMLIRSHSQQLVPHLWGLGIAQAKASIVAITTAHCIPDDDWIANILNTATTQTQSAGFGGGILHPSTFSPCSWAIYFSRYSTFMPPISEGITTEIAGDNAAYRKTALERYWQQPEEGFWETLFHYQLRQHGEKLHISPDIQVRLGKIDNAWNFFRTRFRHGYHYGSTRPEISLIGRLSRIITAPILMPFLLLRIALRIANHRRDWLLVYLVSLPWLVFFLIAWSLGEVIGYLRPQVYETSRIVN